MPTIGELATVVTARTAPFERGMKRAQNSVSTFKKSLAGIGAAFAGLASGALVIGKIRQQFEEIDRLAKTASRLGTTTEALTRLGFAAEISGSSQQALARGLDVMSKRLGEAAAGTGEARSALKQLNIDVFELLTMDPGQQFTVIASAISKMDTQAQKAAATSKIFSRAGLELVNTLDNGEAGLKALAERSDLVGHTLENNTVRQIEAANDALFEMNASVNVLWRNLAINLAPILGSTARQIAEFQSEAGLFAQVAKETAALGGGPAAFAKALGNVVSGNTVFQRLEQGRFLPGQKDLGTELINNQKRLAQWRKEMADQLRPGSPSGGFAGFNPFSDESPIERAQRARFLAGGEAAGSPFDDMQSRQPAGSALAGAAVRGSAAALRIEHQRGGKDEKVVENTKRTADATEALLDAWSDIGFGPVRPVKSLLATGPSNTPG